MADYGTWLERPGSVVTLQLDEMNPRIPSGGTPKEQRDLIAELVEHDNVYQLARDMAENGYYPMESLIGCQKGGKTVILEGNRRLAALKLLISPEQAPPDYVKQFRKLSDKVPVPVTKVRVLHAPSREAAAPLILRKHTREQIEKWSPLMQARFYRSLAASGVALDKLAAQYGTTPGDMTRFLRTDSMYEAACNIELPDDVRKVVQNPRQFPATVLQRLIEIPKTKEFLGIDFDARGAVRGKVNKDEFIKGYRRILTDIVRKKIDTRKLNKVKDADEYLSGLKADEPDKRRKGHFTVNDLATGGSATPPAATDAPKARPKTARSGQSVVPLGTRCTLGNVRMRKVFEELRRLKASSFPNASAVLLRILLELALGNYLDKTGKIQPLLDKAKKERRPTDWYPPLRALLRVFVEDNAIPLKPLERKAARRLNQKDSVLTVEDLDSYVHNRLVSPSEGELRELWTALEGVFKIVLEEPPPATGGTPKQN